MDYVFQAKAIIDTLGIDALIEVMEEHPGFCEEVTLADLIDEE